MSVISTIKETEKRNEFPKLMESELGAVVLFSCEGTGTALKCGDGGYEIGHRSDVWDTDQFTDFSGTITLINGVK